MRKYLWDVVQVIGFSFIAVALLAGADRSTWDVLIAVVCAICALLSVVTLYSKVRPRTEARDLGNAELTIVERETLRQIAADKSSVAAVKHLRGIRTLGLIEAKQTVDAVLAEDPADSTEAIVLDDAGLPGEPPQQPGPGGPTA